MCIGLTGGGLLCIYSIVALRPRAPLPPPPPPQGPDQPQKTGILAHPPLRPPPPPFWAFCEFADFDHFLGVQFYNQEFDHF